MPPTDKHARQAAWRSIRDRASVSEWQRHAVLIQQAAKFLTVGVLNTIVDASLYFILTRWLGFATLKTLAKSISFGAGIINSFFWNKAWTFKSKTSATSTFVPFALANLVALAINVGVMYICLNALDLPEILAFVVATGSSLVWNFTISKFVVFRK